jgi:hypothetical protein
MLSTMKKGIPLLLICALIGCGTSTTSPLVTALEAISIAADVGAPVVSALSPQAAGFINLVPGAVTAALDIAEGKTPLATASTVALDLSNLWEQGNSLLPNLSGTNRTVVAALLAAIQQGLKLFQSQYPPTSAAFDDLVRKGYGHGFVDSPNPAKAKLKLSRKDRAAIARARRHLENAKKAAR